ncbi:hypothetical protein PDE_06886 [Penicillium oxalicum 114-2]|uniref:Uncharacterized protein n=1 Tax=Penicillium oxalicum (strain 114-2 / CGMCC 5302) TaxID=933388 RepID=S8BAT4_PENO1|nr:hypothetical protein PDE_06886 [Penicillium oxalicum 114-2]
MPISEMAKIDPVPETKSTSNTIDRSDPVYLPLEVMTVAQWTG